MATLPQSSLLHGSVQIPVSSTFHSIHCLCPAAHSREAKATVCGVAPNEGQFIQVAMSSKVVL